MLLWMLVALASAGASSASLEPSEPWTLSSQDDGCTVARAFFDEDRAIQIGFQTTMQTRPALLLVRASKKLLPSGIGELPVTLDGAEPVMVHYGSFEALEPGSRLTKLFPDETIMARLAAAKQMVVGAKMPPLHLTGVGAAIEATDRCTAEKLTSWGVDPALYFQRKTATVTGDFIAMFGEESYPREARAIHASGRVLLLLKTDKDGAIAECKVLASSDQSLDAGTCDVAKHGRLKPPLDTTGQPIASFAVLPVRWINP